MCCWVVTVTTISGVRTVPFVRLIRLGFTWNTLLIVICLSFLIFHVMPFDGISDLKAKVAESNELYKSIMVHKE